MTLRPLRLVLAAALWATLLVGCAVGREAPQEALAPETVELPTAAAETLQPTDQTASEPTETVPVDSALVALISEARTAATEGDLERATELWRQIVEQSPDEQRVAHVLELGRLYLRAGQADMAIAQASWAVAVDAPAPLHAEALGLLGSAQEAVGNWRAAATALEAYVSADGRAAPYVWWRIARDHKAVGDITSQIRALESIDADRLQPSFRAEVLSELATAYRANSDPNSAIEVYDRILAFSQLPDYRALISHYKGETLREASHEEEAVASFLHVANTAPESFAAFLSLQELAALPESETVRSTESITPTSTSLVLTDLTRGKIHYHSQEYNLALEYLNYYLHDEPERGAAEAHYYLGLTLAKKGQYEEALAHYTVAIESAGDQALLADAWFANAWTIGASGSDAAPFYHEFYVNHPEHPRAAEALWEAAVASEHAGNWTQAASYYALLAEKYPSDDRAGDAAFRQGLAYYASGDAYTASTTWRERLDVTTDVPLRVRLVVWIGLAAKQAGQLEQADVYWHEAVRISPDSYYGLRAADLLQHAPPRLASGLSATLAPDTLSEADWEGLRVWASSWTTSTGVTLLEDPGYQEADALHALGWSTEANLSTQALQQQIKDSPYEVLHLAESAVRWEAYPTMIWCGQRLARLARDAGMAEIPQALNALAYPDLYGRLVQEYASYYDLDPLLMLALIRQESLFNAEARSSAGALGLAQIMPATGEWIATQIGPEEYADELLLRPVLNLRYSAWYYALLLSMYDRDWIAALVGYNAGPGNVANWTGGQPIVDHDLFFETLPSQQAQDYVRYIYEQYSRYRQIYRPAAIEAEE
ncbi:MAG: transglycosylase SLT domain-containing protein [Chloroflexi bacterium]|nr:transglycosylase SLT domain-containing protein [Chloroflexota bacterium]